MKKDTFVVEDGDMAIRVTVEGSDLGGYLPTIEYLWFGGVIATCSLKDKASIPARSSRERRRWRALEQRAVVVALAKAVQARMRKEN